MRRELAQPRLDTRFDDVREYAFRHQILHQVTYDTLLKRDKRQLHRKAADWFSKLAGARAGDFLGVTAEHYLQAGDEANACEFFVRAAERSGVRYAHDATMAYAAKALALMGDSLHSDMEKLRWRALDVRERSLDLQGKRGEQQADINRLQVVADALDDNHLRAEVAWRRSDVAFRTGDYPLQEQAARETISIAEMANDVEMTLRGQLRLAGALNLLGRVAEGKALAHQGLAQARSLGLRSLESRFLNILSIIASRHSDLVGGLGTEQQTLPIVRELGDRRCEAMTLCNLGGIWFQMGANSPALRHLEDGLRLLRDVGDRGSEPYPLCTLSQLALRQGNDALALTHAQTALDIAVAVQDPYIEANALCVLGDAELALGRFAQARSAFERAHAVSVAHGEARRHDAAAGLARVALAQGDGAGALRALEAELALVSGGSPIKGLEAPHAIRHTCVKALKFAGDPRAYAATVIAHAELLAEAATITDSLLRSSFLRNIPEHHEIVAEWEKIRP